MDLIEMKKSIWLRVAYALCAAVVFAVVPLFIVVPVIAICMPGKLKDVLRHCDAWSANLLGEKAVINAKAGDTNSQAAPAASCSEC
jgi:hypothetical protein